MFSTHRQRGISLISLMVGLLISMVALLGMLSLYGSVVKSTVEATRDARIAGERSAALLVAATQLQGAGFGLAATRADDLLLLTGASLDLDSGSLSGGSDIDDDAEGDTLIWRTRPDGLDTVCAGLHAPASADSGGLYLLLPKPCGSPISAGAWEVRPLILDNSDAVDASLPVAIALLEPAGGCQAMGVAGAGGIRASLSTRDRNTNEIISSTCLLNFSSGVTSP